jgi:hypothetical protein
VIKTVCLERPTRVRAEIQPLPNMTVDKGRRAICMGLKHQHRNWRAFTFSNEKTVIISNMQIQAANP